MRNFELSGLPLEYELMYGSAKRNLNVADFVNNAFLSRVVGSLGPSLKKEVGDLPLVFEIRSLTDDGRDSRVVTFDGV